MSSLQCCYDVINHELTLNARFYDRRICQTNLTKFNKRGLKLRAGFLSTLNSYAKTVYHGVPDCREHNL